MDSIIWRGMTRGELDAAYNNSAAFKNSTEKLAEWSARSARTRSRPGVLLDLQYGRRPRNRIDVFQCGRAQAPLFAFIHGGYWQRNSKEIFACMAEGVLANGFDAALLGYTLAPEATLTDIVDEIRRAIQWLRVQGPRLGIAAEKILLSGWSAGGHLTAAALAEADAGLAISGIFDLEPIRFCYLNEKLGLDAEQARRNSPLLNLPARAAKFSIAYGSDELPELKRQSREFRTAWSAHGLPEEMIEVAGCHHYAVLEQLAQPDGLLAKALAVFAGTDPG